MPETMKATKATETQVQMPLPSGRDAYLILQDAKIAAQNGDYRRCKALSALSAAESAYQTLLVQNLMRVEGNQATEASREQCASLHQMSMDQAQKNHEAFMARQFAESDVREKEASRLRLCLNACAGISDEDLVRGVVPLSEACAVVNAVAANKAKDE